MTDRPKRTRVSRGDVEKIVAEALAAYHYEIADRLMPTAWVKAMAAGKLKLSVPLTFRLKTWWQGLRRER